MTSALKNQDPEEMEGELMDEIEKAMEDDGKLSWPEAKAIVKKLLPKMIKEEFEEAKKNGASEEDLAKAKEWIEENYKMVEDYVLKEVKKGFKECDTDGDKKLDEAELSKCMDDDE